MKIVLDTNVLISGLINPSGPPGRIVDLLRSGDLNLVIDDRILAEYVDVLRRDYFNSYFSFTQRDDIIEYLTRNSIYSIGRFVIHDLPDKWDIPFLEIALTEGIPLITGNMKHFPKTKIENAKVITPASFLQNYF